MKPYKNLNRNSGVLTYDHGDNWIKIQFKRSGIYEYSASRIGDKHISVMKRLADSGSGLNTYINDNDDVKNGYSPRH